jgi:hypothetical protein
VHDISMTSPAPLRIRSGVLIVRPRMTATAMAATWAAYLTINEGLRLTRGRARPRGRDGNWGLVR